MCDYDFSSIFTPIRQYTLIKCIHQNWYNTGFSYSSKARPDHGLLYLRKGHIRFDYELGQYIGSAGDLFFLPKGSHYEACVPAEYGTTGDFLINFELDIPYPDHLPQHPVRLFHADDHNLTEIFERIVRSYNINQTRFYVMGQFYLLLDQLVMKLQAPSTTARPFLLQAETLLEESTHSIAQIAKLCGVSESGLRSRFKEAYGISPQQFRMNSKLDRAKRLLETTDLSVYQIAEQLGFYDEAYFCKMFRKYTGSSPRKYADKKSI